ncbi:MAG: 2-oxoacid:acceptor oxidoreductase family protein [Gemmatimonadota bacterium]|jgi:pyruvate-ferredoxin/flavodoxin oxidoreductase
MSTDTRTKPGIETERDVRFPGIPVATDGSEAVVHAETLASEAAGAYPITPSTQMGEGWAQAVAAGKTNAFGRRLIFFEPEGEHAAAGVTAGMSMVGLRSTNFSSGQGIAYMHESLYAAAGKRLTYVLNVAARAMTKHALNVHAGHDDYHAVDDSGFFQLFSKDVQEIADFTLIAHRIAELSLNPGLSAQDGFLTSHVIETVNLPEPELVREYLGDPSDLIDCPTPAQRLVFGEQRRRIPELFDLDYPAMLGSVQNQDSYAQGVAAQRPFYFDHVRALADQAFEEYAALTGRRYGRVQAYRMDDADWVLVGQGSVVPNAEAVADYLRQHEGLKVGVLNVSMFRPFPADLVTRHLRGKKGVTVLERLDQPLSVDAPLLREIRAAMGQGVENHRHAKPAKKRRLTMAGADQTSDLPYPGLALVHPDEVPDFYSAGFGFGSRDLQPGDLVAATHNMLPDPEGGRRNRRQFYLGVEFVRKNTRLPKLQIWQEQLEDAYPDIAERALESAGNFNLLPADTVSLRIHSVGGWGAITTGKNLGLTAFELFGLNVKANPKYGSEKKGQPTTFYATLSRDKVRLNSELKHVTVVLSPDGNVFRHSNPLAGLEPGGVFIIQSEQEPEKVWEDLPDFARRTILEKRIKVFALDGFAIASEEATDPELRYRMQGAAFMGAFFRGAPLLEREGMSEADLFDGIRDRLQAKFGSKGQQVVEDNFRVIHRGYSEVREVPTGAEVGAEAAGEAPGGHMPTIMQSPDAAQGIGDPGRFFEQVCSICAVGQDGIADPFAAISAMPAATSAVRDMTNIRFEVPSFVPEKCTGCSQCWVQCPDAAIPGLVNTVEDVLDHAIRYTADGHPNVRLQQVQKHLAKETRKVLEAVEFKTFGDAFKTAYGNLVERLGWDAEKRNELDAEFTRVYSLVADFPFAKTVPFWDVPERKEKGSGGLLSITISPEACKGCNICVDVCPEDALVTVRQDEEVVDLLRRNWKFWEELPDTGDRYVNIRDLDEGIGVLSSLLLRKDNYRSMAGGDGACMGCGEKTAVHLVTSTIEALMQPRVKAFVGRLDDLVAELERQERDIVASRTDVEAAADAEDAVAVELAGEDRERIRTLERARKELQDLRWRYTVGPSGKGRAPMGISNSTGCSSVWGSTYPYNPYPFPWVNHLFQDAPSIAIGIFEGHMRKMADAFTAVRRAEKLVDGSYDAESDEAFFQAFDWQQFNDEEFKLCPPILSIGGDGAMLDIGFQNLSRLMASGKPIRVLVLDTQVYSNTGGQACTSGFTGQVADMSAWGKAQHGKTEVRKELGFIALAHRGVFVHQTSQALASHLIEGVIKGLNSRRPAVFNVYTPCPVEHGLADDWAPTAAKYALEARAFPFFTYDPDGGESLSECLNLDGNPDVDSTWPTYELTYEDENGDRATLEVPMTIADWAATETRFRKHFKRIAPDAWSEDQVPFDEFVEMDAEEREGRKPFIHVVEHDGKLGRLSVSKEMVVLAEERLHFWHQLREMAGLDVPARARGLVVRELEKEFESKMARLHTEYEEKVNELKSRYPRVVARRMAEGLMRFGGDRTISDLLKEAESLPGLDPVGPEDLLDLAPGSGPGGNGGGTATAAPPAPAKEAQEAPAAEAEAAPAVAEEEDDELRMEPYIDTPMCTSCNDCLNINGQMFAYDENKQAYIKDPRAGTFAQLVQAAEKCPAAIIHPGDPLDKNEPDLEKWVKRAEPFN